MSFSQEVKLELIELNFPPNDLVASDQLLFFLSAFWQEKGHPNKIELASVEVAHFMEEAIKVVSGIEKNHFESYHRTLVYDDLGPFFALLPRELVKEYEGFYLAGLFLASGALASPLSSDYHFELAIGDMERANFVLKLIKSYRLNPRLIKRRGKWIVYLKRAVEIADMLALIQAPTKMLEFESFRIEKDYYASSTRVNNCEIANHVKIIKTAERQIEAIKRIGIDKLPYKLGVIASLRIEHPEFSNGELARLYQERTGESANKAFIAYNLRKIEEIK